MGNFLLGGSKPDKKLLKFFRKSIFTFLLISVPLFKVFDCFDYYFKHYHPENWLSEEQFDDIFAPILNCC